MVFTLCGAVGSGSVPAEATLRRIGLDYQAVEAPNWEGESEIGSQAIAGEPRRSLKRSMA